MLIIFCHAACQSAAIYGQPLFDNYLTNFS